MLEIRKVWEQEIIPQARELAAPCKRVLVVGVMKPNAEGSGPRGDYREMFPDAYVFSIDNNYAKKADWVVSVEGNWLENYLDIEYDLILYNGMIEYVLDNMAAFRNMRRLLRKGGILAIGAPYVWPSYVFGQRKKIYWAGITPRGLDELIKQTGFEKVEPFREIGPHDYLYAIARAV